jgi:hypothetical protein
VYAIEGKLAAGQENDERDPSVQGLHPERNHIDRTLHFRYELKEWLD